jgi:hypothetical protein
LRERVVALGAVSHDNHEQQLIHPLREPTASDEED